MNASVLEVPSAFFAPRDVATAVSSFGVIRRISSDAACTLLALVSGVMTCPIRFARTLRRGATFAERHLWKHLRAHRLSGYYFRRQQPLGPYIVDFACKKRRLVIEVDGMSHASRAEYDRLRTQYLRRMGYRVLRFSNDRVLLETRAVLRSIQRHLGIPKR